MLQGQFVGVVNEAPADQLTSERMQKCLRLCYKQWIKGGGGDCFLLPRTCLLVAVETKPTEFDAVILPQGVKLCCLTEIFSSSGIRTRTSSYSSFRPVNWLMARMGFWESLDGRLFGPSGLLNAVKLQQNGQVWKLIFDGKNLKLVKNQHFHCRQTEQKLVQRKCFYFFFEAKWDGTT